MLERERSGGRPTLLTPELAHDICARVSAHGFEAVAAEAVGIHRQTVASWRKRGEAGEPEFAAFARELAAAKAQFIERQLDQVDDPRWKLERVDRQQFGAMQKVEHTGDDGKPIEHAHKHEHTLSREQSLEIVSKVLGVRRELVENKFKGRQLEETGDERVTKAEAFVNCG